MAERRLGPLNEKQIEQRGEAWQSVADEFQVLDKPHLQKLRSQSVGVLQS